MQTRSQTKNKNTTSNVDEPANVSYDIDKHIAMLEDQLMALKKEIKELIHTKQKSCKHTNKKHIETKNHGYGCYSEIYRCVNCNKLFEI